jgi:hypothetical protein
MFKYNVQLDKSRDVYVATVPYRHIEWEGATETDAIGNLIKGVADLAYTGSLDPEDPERMGCRPLQHVMNVLTDRVTWQLEQRQYTIETSDDDSVNISYHNEVIAGLATAIAAIARVKAL